MSDVAIVSAVVCVALIVAAVVFVLSGYFGWAGVMLIIMLSVRVSE